MNTQRSTSSQCLAKCGHGPGKWPTITESARGTQCHRAHQHIVPYCTKSKAQPKAADCGLLSANTVTNSLRNTNYYYQDANTTYEARHAANARHEHQSIVTSRHLSAFGHLFVDTKHHRAKHKNCIANICIISLAHNQCLHALNRIRFGTLTNGDLQSKLGKPIHCNNTSRLHPIEVLKYNMHHCIARMCQCNGT